MHSKESGDEDWRLQSQEKYLMEATLVRRRYRAPPHNPNWDHDHCAFCWEKLQVEEDPGQTPIGYATEDDSHWICEQCFADFRSRFRWKLAATPDA